jgi:hypothetical protein
LAHAGVLATFEILDVEHYPPVPKGLRPWPDPKFTISVPTLGICIKIRKQEKIEKASGFRTIGDLRGIPEMTFARHRMLYPPMASRAIYEAVLDRAI